MNATIRNDRSVSSARPGRARSCRAVIPRRQAAVFGARQAWPRSGRTDFHANRTPAWVARVGPWGIRHFRFPAGANSIKYQYLFSYKSENIQNKFRSNSAYVQESVSIHSEYSQHLFDIRSDARLAARRIRSVMQPASKVIYSGGFKIKEN
jgi:hypothetical protein